MSMGITCRSFTITNIDRIAGTVEVRMVLDDHLTTSAAAEILSTTRAQFVFQAFIFAKAAQLACDNGYHEQEAVIIALADALKCGPAVAFGPPAPERPRGNA